MEGAISNGWRRLPPKFVGETDLGGRLAPLGSGGQCVLTHSIRGVECAREIRAAWEFFFFLMQKELATIPGNET